MITEMPGTKKGECSGMCLFMLHAACFLLVIVYVNMFQFWAWLSKQLGPGQPAKILPIIVTLVVLLVVSFYFIKRVNRGYRIKFVFLGLGIVSAFLALAIPDPHVPIKRIHVAEYIILSFLVRYALSYRLEGLRLTLFTVLVTALYGVHDEMLQGLHSLRYYGWRDIIVNSVAGLSGAMLGHGLVCFEANKPERPARLEESIPAGQALFFLGLFGGVVWQVIYLYQHRENIVVYLAIVPVIACCVMIAGLYPSSVFSSNKTHGLQVAYWLALALVVYPVLSGLNWIEFR